MRSERVYEVAFTIPWNEEGLAFIMDLIESSTINTRDNEEGQVITISDLRIQNVERMVK